MTLLLLGIDTEDISSINGKEKLVIGMFSENGHMTRNVDNPEMVKEFENLLLQMIDIFEGTRKKMGV